LSNAGYENARDMVVHSAIPASGLARRKRSATNSRHLVGMATARNPPGLSLTEIGTAGFEPDAHCLPRSWPKCVARVGARTIAYVIEQLYLRASASATFRVLAKGDLDAPAALASGGGLPLPPRSLTPPRRPL
jgi:hypothetical protein